MFFVALQWTDHFKVIELRYRAFLSDLEEKELSGYPQIISRFPDYNMLCGLLVI